MSDFPRFLTRGRKAAADAVRPDYSEPDFSAWSANLDAFMASAPESVPEPAPEAARETAPAAVSVGSVSPAPVQEAAGKPSALTEELQKMLNFDGAMCVALADSESGMVLGQAGSGIEMERAAAGASMILRARRATVKALALPDQIDDLLMTLTTQLHIIRPLTNKPTMFIYLVADRSKASLAMARYKATEADAQIIL
ncbi:MAG: hypothetical protein ABIR17_11400 [Pseudolysinimonas sp.]|uniref:hypothetical protein n=1 Tax=Pseudolysinimonas sp. TaxID=2680009 RepID=UPI0032655D55